VRLLSTVEHINSTLLVLPADLQDKVALLVQAKVGAAGLWLGAM
jgi:hypothetical protein